MQKIKKDELPFSFVPEIYEKNPHFITSDLFWDGGTNAENTLKEKQQFYCLANEMSDIIKKIITELNETVYISQYFCEYNNMYAHWKDLKQIDLFRRVSDIVKRNSYYKLSLPEDNGIIDLIVESNFLYYTYISFYLPETKTILLPSCHTEIQVYSDNHKLIDEVILKSIAGCENNIKYCASDT